MWNLQKTQMNNCDKNRNRPQLQRKKTSGYQWAERRVEGQDSFRELRDKIVIYKINKIQGYIV